MEVNPYESPRPGERTDDRIPDDAHSVRQLLIEIRDGARPIRPIARHLIRRCPLLQEHHSRRRLHPNNHETVANP